MRMVPFMHGMIAVSDEFMVNYIEGIEEAKTTKNLKVTKLHDGSLDFRYAYGLVSYASLGVVLTGG